MAELEDWQDALEIARCAAVVPRRSVDRIRRAVAEGRDIEPYLEDIEHGMTTIADICAAMDERPPTCQACLGTGRVMPNTDAPGQQDGSGG